MPRKTEANARRVFVSPGADWSGFVLVGAFERQARLDGWPEEEIREVIDKVGNAIAAALAPHVTFPKE